MVKSVDDRFIGAATKSDSCTNENNARINRAIREPKVLGYPPFVIDWQVSASYAV